MDGSNMIITSLVLVFASYYGVLGQQNVEIIPRTAVVKVGDTVSLMCRSGKPLQYCRMEHIASLQSWNLKPGASKVGGISYYGAGLESGQCGITLERVQTSFNGMYRCTMGFMEGNDEAKGNMNLTVAVSPATPELQVTESSNRKGVYKDQDTLRASCIIRDGRPVANLSWYIDDELISGRELSMPLVTHIMKEDLYSIQQNLTYQLSWRDNGKALKCMAQHLALEDRNNQTSFQINVQFAPRQHSGDIEQFGIVLGEEGLIKVDVEANPQPSLRWTISGETILEGQQDQTNRFEAVPIKNKGGLGGGSWEAELRILSVTSEDVDREYSLRAINSLGEQTYRIVLSTSSEAPTVLELGAGPIIGIVVAILVLLLAVFLLIFARATGRWCFAGGVGGGTRRQDPKESKKFLSWDKSLSTKDDLHDENVELSTPSRVDERQDERNIRQAQTHT